MVDFVMKYPEKCNNWHRDSNYMVQLEVQDEEALIKLSVNLKMNDITHVVFREPDLDNAITAIAIEPTGKADKMLKNMKLLFK